MANIELTLRINNELIGWGTGIIDEDGKITYTARSGPIPASHGQLNINETYIQLKELTKTKYKGKSSKIEISVES